MRGEVALRGMWKVGTIGVHGCEVLLAHENSGRRGNRGRRRDNS